MSRAVHPSGSQLGRVCIHYKESLSIKMLNINYVQERICFNLKIKSKHCTIVSLYRSVINRSVIIQSADECEIFSKQIKSDYGISYSK